MNVTDTPNDDALAARLDSLVAAPIENRNGNVVGAIRPSSELGF